MYMYVYLGPLLNIQLSNYVRITPQGQLQVLLPTLFPRPGPCLTASGCPRTRQKRSQTTRFLQRGIFWFTYCLSHNLYALYEMRAYTPHDSDNQIFQRGRIYNRIHYNEIWLHLGDVTLCDIHNNVIIIIFLFPFFPPCFPSCGWRRFTNEVAPALDGQSNLDIAECARHTIIHNTAD